MKKFTVLLALLLGLLLVSCGAPMTPSAVTPAAEENGITLKTQFPVYAPDVPFIQFSIINNSGEMAEFGTEWSVERLEGDAWYSVPFKPNTAWTQPLYMLLDGGTASDTAHLSMLDHKFKDGTYRIVKEINDTFYTAEFAIGDSPVGGDSPYGYLPFDRLNKDYTVQDAEDDGVIMLSRFFLEKSFGMGSELRYCTIREDGSLLLTSLTVEEHCSSDRIRYETTAGVKRYFAYVITDGENIALSAYPTWMEEDDTRMILDDLRGNSSILQTLQNLLFFSVAKIVVIILHKTFRGVFIAFLNPMHITVFSDCFRFYNQPRLFTGLPYHGCHRFLVLFNATARKLIIVIFGTVNHRDLSVGNDDAPCRVSRKGVRAAGVVTFIHFK